MFAWLSNLFKPPYPHVLDEVNRYVNSRMVFQNDIKHYGKSDVWVRNPEDSIGDCEDYALTKMDGLINAGIPPEDLDIQLCFRKNKNGVTEAHAVLVYKGKWVLDNLSRTIWEKKNTPYFNWIANEGYRKIHDGKENA